MEKYPEFFGFSKEETPAKERADINQLRERGRMLISDADPQQQQAGRALMEDAKNREDYLKEKLDAAFELYYKKTTGLQEGSIKAYEKASDEARARIQAYPTMRENLMRLANLYENYKAGRLEGISAQWSGVMNALGLEKLATVDPGKYDEAMKDAMLIALQSVQTAGFQRAPLAMAEKELAKSPSPTIEARAVHKIIRTMIGEMDYQMARDRAFAKAPAGITPLKFDAQWAERKDEQPSKYMVNVLREIPTFEGMTREQIEEIANEYGVKPEEVGRQARERKAQTAPPAQKPTAVPGQEIPPAPAPLRDMPGLTFSKSLQQFRDAEGNTYDMSGKRVQ